MWPWVYCVIVGVEVDRGVDREVLEALAHARASFAIRRIWRHL